MKRKEKVTCFGIELLSRTLQKIVIEDFGFEETDVDLELSYLPIGLMNLSEWPLVIILTPSSKFCGLARSVYARFFVIFGIFIRIE